MEIIIGILAFIAGVAVEYYFPSAISNAITWVRSKFGAKNG